MGHEIASNMALREAGILVFGAGYSIDLLCPIGFGEIELVHDIMNMIDIRLPHRCLLTSPATLKEQLFQEEKRRPLPGDDLSKSAQSILRHLEQLRSQDWEIRWIDTLPDYSCIIVDKEYVIGKNVSPNPDWTTPYIYYEHDADVRAIVANFEKRWVNAAPVEELYRANKVIAPGQRLAVPSQAYWTSFIQSLARNPNDLRSMGPRRFEELVAELLVREGMEVQLTPPKSD